MSKSTPPNRPNEETVAAYEKRMQAAYRAEQWRQLPQAMALLNLAGGLKDESLDSITSGADWRAASDWWPFALLREAANEGDREGCQRMLLYFLVKLNVPLPTGVLVSYRKRGRPKQTEQIYQAWVKHGRPAITWRECERLALSFYPGECATAKSDPGLRKKLRDRIRATLLRHHVEIAATKIPQIS